MKVGSNPNLIDGFPFFFSLVVQFGSLLGINDMNADQMTKKLEDTLPVIQQVSQQFKNPV